MRYKLPEALGGGECRLLDTLPVTGWVRVTVGDGDEAFTVDLHGGLLTPVAPPLPPEPPVGSVVLDQNGRVWQSRAGRPGPDSTSQWQSVMGGQQPWSYVGTLSPTLLVPDPLAEPVELPWKSGMGPELAIEKAIGCGCHGETDGAQLIGVVVGDQSAHVQPQEARTFARALWAAANAAEAVT